MQRCEHTHTQQCRALLLKLQTVPVTINPSAELIGSNPLTSPLSKAIKCQRNLAFNDDRCRRRQVPEKNRERHPWEVGQDNRIVSML